MTAEIKEKKETKRMKQTVTALKIIFGVSELIDFKKI